LSSCISGASPYINLGDDGHSLSLDGAPDGTKAGITIAETQCMFRHLDTPDSIIARMGNTRALDGMQDEDGGGLHYTWTYHPDDGLDIIIEEPTS
jgi:hypothetical protein